MTPLALLNLATDLVRDVLVLQHPADAVITSFFRAHRIKEGRARQTLSETAYAVLRRRSLYQHLAELRSREAVAEDRVPLARLMAILAWQGDEGFLKAALTPTEQAKLARARAVKSDNLAARLRHNLPDWLSALLEPACGRDFWPLVHTLDQLPPLDLRVNTLKTDRDTALQVLRDAGMGVQLCPYSPWGLRVQGRPPLHRLALFNDGAVEVQDEGSQLLALLVDAQRGETVVDFCAGAGGKTLALGAAMGNSGRLLALDTNERRLAALKPRLARSGLSNVQPVVLSSDHDQKLKRLQGKADRVLVDAPCSGLGTLRRNPDLKWRITPESITDLVVQQRAILARAARLLKPGGRLVYATCSLLVAENEAIAQAFDAEHAASFEPLPVADLLTALQVPDAQTLCEGPYLRLWPHRHATDGFFAAAWVKR
jgi:16S rRNA (cytosine967-C5)-methyltransferase